MEQVRVIAHLEIQTSQENPRVESCSPSVVHLIVTNTFVANLCAPAIIHVLTEKKQQQSSLSETLWCEKLVS